MDTTEVAQPMCRTHPLSANRFILIVLVVTLGHSKYVPQRGVIDMHVHMPIFSHITLKEVEG